MAKTLDSTEIWVDATDGRTQAYKYKIETILNSQDVDSNTSNITINFYCMGVKTYFTQWDDGDATWLTTSSYGASIDNSATIRSQKSVPAKNTWYLFGTYNNSFAHKNDGTLTITTSINYGFASQTYLPANTTITASNVVVDTIARNPIMYTNVSGSWKRGNFYTNVNGTWKKITNIYVNVNGSWKQVTEKGNI